MFLISNILRNLITTLEFPQLKWLLIFESKHVNIDFHTFLLQLQNQILYWNKTDKTDFWVPWNISNQIHLIQCPKLLYRFEKIHKVFKSKVLGCSTPLTPMQFCWEPLISYKNSPDKFVIPFNSQLAIHF